jgi:hypothetical protein
MSSILCTSLPWLSLSYPNREQTINECFNNSNTPGKKKRFEQLDIGNKRLEEMKNIKFQWEKERREKQNKE